MLDKMKQLMEMKKQAEFIKKELSRTQLEVNAVPGIRLTVTGAQEFRSLEIVPERLTLDQKAQLEKDLLESINAAIQKVQQAGAEKMSAYMPKF